MVAVAAPWTEELVTYANRPGLGAVLATVPITAASLNQFIVVDVTNQVRSWVTTPSSNHGFELVAVGTTSVQFDTKEGNMAPTLDITVLAEEEQQAQQRPFLSGPSPQARRAAALRLTTQARRRLRCSISRSRRATLVHKVRQDPFSLAALQGSACTVQGIPLRRSNGPGGSWRNTAQRMTPLVYRAHASVRQLHLYRAPAAAPSAIRPQARRYSASATRSLPINLDRRQRR